MFRGKERRERKHRYVELNKVIEDFCTLKTNCNGNRRVGKQTKEQR